MTESEIKAECERLARKAWPGMSAEVQFMPQVSSYFVIVGGGLLDAKVVESTSPESLLAAIRVLANEPDPRDAEIARLRAQLYKWESAARAALARPKAVPRAWAWKRLAKRLRNLQREAHEAMMRNNDAWQRKYDVDVGLARKQLDGMTQVAEHRAEELRKLRDGVRRIADDFARNECDADEYNKCSWGHAAARLVALLGEE